MQTQKPLAAAPLQMQPPQPPPAFPGSFGPPSGVPLQRQAQLGPLGDGLMQPPPAQTPSAASLQKPPLPQMQPPTSQQQQQQSPGGPLSGVPLQRPAAQQGPPSGGRMQPRVFPDPAVIKPLQPIAPLTLPPTAPQPRPVMQSGGQIQAPGDALQGHAQPPLQGHPVAFQQPPQTQSLQALQDQQLQQQQRVKIGAENASGFREAGGAAPGNAGPMPAAVPPSAFAASAGFPAGGPRSGLPRRLQVPPRALHLCQSLSQPMLRPAETLHLSPNLDCLTAHVTWGASWTTHCLMYKDMDLSLGKGAHWSLWLLQEQSGGSQHGSGAYLSAQNSMLPPQGQSRACASPGLQSLPSGGSLIQTQGT